MQDNEEYRVLEKMACTKNNNNKTWINIFKLIINGKARQWMNNSMVGWVTCGTYIQPAMMQCLAFQQIIIQSVLKTYILG